MRRSRLLLATVLTLGSALDSNWIARAQQSAPPTQEARPRPAPETLEELKKIADISSKGQYQAAEAAARELLARVEKTIGPDSVDAAKAIDFLTENMWLGGKGRDPEARRLIDRSIDIKRRLLGPDHPETAFSVRNLATLLQRNGDYGGARPLFEQALAIYEKALGPDHSQVGWTSVNFGILLREMGDYPAARASLERAVGIYERINLPGGLAIASNNLVGVLVAMKDFAGARRQAERAVEISLKRNGPGHPSTATYQANLGGVLAMMLDYPAAKEAFERALPVLIKRLGPDHPSVAEITHNLAECLFVLGDAAEAKATYARASSIYEKTYSPTHPTAVQTITAMATLLADTGDMAASFETALRAEKLGLEHQRLTVRALPERQALRVAATRHSALDLALTIVSRRPEEMASKAPAVWDALIRARATVLDEMAARRVALGGADDPEIATLTRQLAAARSRLAAIEVRGPEGDDPERYLKLVDQARRQREQAEQALAEKSLRFREEVGRSRIGWQEVLRALPPRAGLVAFVRYGRQELAGERTPGKPPKTFPSYMALVYHASANAPALIDLGPVQPVESLVSRWRAEVAREAESPGRASQRMEASYRAVATELREKVWDPIAPHLQGLDTVFLVPDGSLHLVSFAALPVGQTDYLVERGPVIHYLSAERDLAQTQEKTSNQGLLALGAPAFDDTRPFAGLTPGVPTFRGSRAACDSFASMRFPPLPESDREARDVVARWKKTSAAANATTIRHLHGAEATETAFKSQAPGMRVLHLATHGFFLGGGCQSAPGENPLLRSGLALAGANNRKAAGANEDDGILTAEEIAAIDLRGVEWAVLSACDTGLGEVRAGEGVFGLRRAFQVAGARTLVMSLWPVDDEAARLWMGALYEGRFDKRLDTARAAQRANVTVLTARRASKQSTHPFYWAGFVAAGDWR